MSELFSTIDRLPDVSFIDGMTLEDIQSQLVGDFVSKYQEITGRKIILSKADPNRIILLACAQVLNQGFQNIDKAGKMNFLKYAYGEYLDNMGALKRVVRNPAQKATAPVKFTLSSARESATSIPEGTRVTADYDAYFETTEYAEIPAGETEVTVSMRCTEAGSIGNDFAAGELSTLVDLVPFIAEVANVRKSSGGTDEEDDQSMAERVYIAPSSYSTAGSDDAYEYWVKDCSPEIGDVRITSPSAGVVDVRFVMDDGSLPDDEVIAAVTAALNQRGRRPLTDRVQVLRPDIEEYSVDITYYINASDSNSALAIQELASEAVEEYTLWQTGRIGRDINPDELIARLNAAGVKRTVVRSPEFRVIADTAKAKCTGVHVTYGGLEDD